MRVLDDFIVCIVSFHDGQDVWSDSSLQCQKRYTTIHTKAGAHTVVTVATLPVDFDAVI